MYLIEKQAKDTCCVQVDCRFRLNLILQKNQHIDRENQEPLTIMKSWSYLIIFEFFQLLLSSTFLMIMLYLFFLMLQSRKHRLQRPIN